MIIKNREELISSSLRARAVELIEAGINRVMPANLLKASVKFRRSRKVLTVAGVNYDLSKGRLFIIGGGKASGVMSEEIEQIIGPENIAAGIVNCSADNYLTKKIEIIKAGHPVPDIAGVQGVRSMLALKARYSIGADDVILCLISGGGSALIPCPASGITLDDKQRITQLLLGCGASIQEINMVRKHLSLTKGGRLGEYYDPSRIISLVISDVVGDDLNTIASGPTVPDQSTFEDAFRVLDKYHIAEKAPPNTVNFIMRGRKGMEAESPKELYNCDNYIVGNNRMALEAMEEKAKDLGLRPVTVTAELTGDTAEVANKIAADILHGKYKGCDVIMLGGETTPTLPEKAGKGGRNQHYAAVSMLAMQEYGLPWLAASVATDGSDYLPDVAGAIVDNRSLASALSSRIDVMDHISRFDSNTLFSQLGRSLILTGNTGTNVGDILIYLLG